MQENWLCNTVSMQQTINWSEFMGPRYLPKFAAPNHQNLGRLTFEPFQPWTETSMIFWHCAFSVTRICFVSQNMFCHTVNYTCLVVQVSSFKTLNLVAVQWKIQNLKNHTPRKIPSRRKVTGGEEEEKNNSVLPATRLQSFHFCYVLEYPYHKIPDWPHQSRFPKINNIPANFPQFLA